MTTALSVLDQGKVLEFTFDDGLRYHGPQAPGGVAHAYKVIERALEVLGTDGPVERRELVVTTSHGGPGVRDTFELVTRGVTEGRYTVDPALARPERGTTLEIYVFQIDYRGKSITLIIRDAGFVVDEFIALVGKAEKSAADLGRLEVLKLEMTERVMAAPADQIYDVVPSAVAQ
ncbi:hypothetical protein [Rhodococcus sp. ARC_M6]|uniref:hypothetical protein n=1 Tax=Rhodococcus sp. ARC_M6 TaxID=2928852 RepID=UPI001FB1F51E|nr:hypothetical protein [Rhodococcus sp. ARC_M6]MCJ0907448.1 hypothetical protein [Rhodococcus sp. ARC_M6]